MCMDKVLWWLILGTKGGINRARIIKKLNERPYNANQLTEELDVSYRTIRHHIKILEDAKIIKSAGQKYGKIYFLSDDMDKNYDDFEVIWKKVREDD